jgi:hypothetical protein
MMERMETTTTGARARGKDRLFNSSVSDRPFWPVPENGIIFLLIPHLATSRLIRVEIYYYILYFILFPIRG